MPTMTTESPARARTHATTHEPVAVLGLGYVGLPTALALMDAGLAVTGIDVSERRLDAIRRRDVDLLPRDRARLDAALELPHFRITADTSEVARARTVLVCVPTPVDSYRRPDLSALRGACETVVRHARRGQTIVLTSTSYVGTTRELLVEPLERRGLEVGRDVCVAFSPERVDPGNAAHDQETVPRVLGAVTPECADTAERVLEHVATHVHRVSSPEAAELTKLQENTFRAVNIALANEMAEAGRALGLDPIEVTRAAATKPYGYMPFYPGAGVGGHCIPCDPHYLLSSLDEREVETPVIEQAMDAIADRPVRVVEDAEQALAARGVGVPGARVLVLGAAYKPGVRDVRESPAIEILQGLADLGAEVAFHDALVPTVTLHDGTRLESVADPSAEDWDLVVGVTVHQPSGCSWLDDVPLVLDCTHRLRTAPAAAAAAS